MLTIEKVCNSLNIKTKVDRHGNLKGDCLEIKYLIERMNDNKIPLTLKNINEEYKKQHNKGEQKK